MENCIAYWTYLYDQEGCVEKSDDFETYKEAIEGYEAFKKIASSGMQVQVWGRTEDDEATCIESEVI